MILNAYKYLRFHGFTLREDLQHSTSLAGIWAKSSVQRGVSKGVKDGHRLSAVKQP
jgi:hypothetical protein